jgi:hypothetical protein
MTDSSRFTAQMATTSKTLKDYAPAKKRIKVLLLGALEVEVAVWSENKTAQSLPEFIEAHEFMRDCTLAQSRELLEDKDIVPVKSVMVKGKSLNNDPREEALAALFDLPEYLLSTDKVVYVPDTTEINLIGEDEILEQEEDNVVVKTITFMIAELFPVAKQFYAGDGTGLNPAAKQVLRYILGSSTEELELKLQQPDAVKYLGVVAPEEQLVAATSTKAKAKLAQLRGMTA